MCWDLDHVEAFDAASEVVRLEDVREGGVRLRRPGRARRAPGRPGRAGLRRDLPAPRRPDPGPVPRRLRQRRAAAARRHGRRSERRMRITETSDLWWKTAVIYCLDVETFLDWNDDGKGDFPGLAQRLDYLASLGVTCLWLMPFYPDPGPRRRLRHRRLLRRGPAAGHARRPGRGDPDRPGPRHAGDRRPGGQPHLRQASLVQVGPGQPDLEVPRLLRLVRPRRRRAPRPSRPSPTRRPASGPSTSRPASTTCTASTSTSPTSTWPTRWSATRSPRSWASGCSSGCPASGSTPCRSSWRPWACRTPRPRCPTRTSTSGTCGRC